MLFGFPLSCSTFLVTSFRQLAPDKKILSVGENVEANLKGGAVDCSRCCCCCNFIPCYFNSSSRTVCGLITLTNVKIADATSISKRESKAKEWPLTQIPRHNSYIPPCMTGGHASHLANKYVGLLRLRVSVCVCLLTTTTSHKLTSTWHLGKFFDKVFFFFFAVAFWTIF